MNQKVLISLILAAAFAAFPGCCGFLSDAGNYQASVGRDEPEEPGSVKNSGFEGYYKVLNEESDDFTLGISKEGKYYVLEWGEPATEPWISYGVKVGDYLGTYLYEDEDILLGIYKRDGSGITGIWDVSGEFIYDLTEGADELKLSTYDFEGTYVMESPDPENEEIYDYFLEIKKAGDLYSVTEVYEGGYELTGSGLAVDDVIVMAVPVGGTVVAKMLRLRGSRLDGKLFYSYYDDEADMVKVEITEEKGQKE